MYISIEQACKLYNKLVTAMNDSIEFELYAYTLMAYKPQPLDLNYPLILKTRAAQSLIDMIIMFQEHYPNTVVLINELAPDTWFEKEVQFFNHRVLINVSIT